MPYSQEHANEAFTVPNDGWWRLRCCDCGLVHLLHTKTVSKERIQVIARRDERATGASRRSKKYKRKEP